MRLQFGVLKFMRMVLPCSFTVLVSSAVGISDSIMVGNLIGENALAGVNLIGSCLSIVMFVAGLISIGCGTVYSIEMGKCDTLRARQFFMQSLWTSLILGGAMMLLMLFGRGIFVAMMGASPEISQYAYDYMGWISPACLEVCLLGLLVTLGYADGDARLCMLAYVVVVALNIAISIVLIKFGMGMKGCALGSVIALLGGIAILATHLPKKTNTFRPVRHFSFRDSLSIVGASLGDAATSLCEGLLFLFLNMFVVAYYGSEMLPVVAAITLLLGILEVFNGIGAAVQPIVTVYYGEKNTKSMRKVMNAAMLISAAEGAAVTVVLLIWPQLMAKISGIVDPAMVRETMVAVRWQCISFIALSLAGLLNAYYMYIEKPMFSGIIAVLCYLVFPIACVAVGSIFGRTWMWAGFGVGSLAGLLFSALIIISLEGMKMFPLMIPRSRDSRLHVFDCELNDKEIVETSRQIAETLKTENQPTSTVIRASLMAEEVMMAVKDRNVGRKVLAEATLDLNDGVSMTLRDDGEIFDITDADAKVSSLRSFLVASMMQYHEGRLNLVTTGFNRNVFKF